MGRPYFRNGTPPKYLYGYEQLSSIEAEGLDAFQNAIKKKGRVI